MEPSRVSVVMATQNAASELSKCLGSLDSQTLREDTEIIVADCSTDGTDRFIATQYPTVRLLHFSRPLSTPELLKQALREAHGSIVAVTDPRCLFPSNWLEKLQRAHESEFAVVGGAVEHGGPYGLVGWACYFSDYGAFMLPAPRRMTSVLAGNHVSYRGSLIEQFIGSMQDGYVKVFFHSALERQGIRFLFDPELVISCAQCESFWGFSRRYYRDALRFAALRCRRISLTARFLRLATAPALPPLLLFRRVAAVWGKKKNRIRLLLSIPLLAVFVTSWSAGELAGYLLGPRTRLGSNTAGPVTLGSV